MKRSEVNRAIRNALDTLARHRIRLPPFGYWSAEDWRRLGPEGDRLRVNAMGGDVTDFGEGDFPRYGAVLFTLRNGNHRNRSTVSISFRPVRSRNSSNTPAVGCSGSATSARPMPMPTATGGATRW